MENNIKLSVLVFCYNQEQYIAQTIESIVSQEHNYSYELIICDDASKDNTPKIIKDYYEKFPDIIIPVLREKNLGLIGNYYDGLSRLTGEYIMVCAGDDYWLPGKVESQIAYMDEHPNAGLCYGDAIKVNNNNRIIGIAKGKKDNSFNKLIELDHVPAVTICIRKKTLSQYIQIVNPKEKTWLMEDYPMLLWFSLNSMIGYIESDLAAYRIQDESACHSKNAVKLIDFRNSVKNVRYYFLYQISKDEKYSIIKAYRYLFNDLMSSYYQYKNDSYFISVLKATLNNCKYGIFLLFFHNLRIRYSLFNRIYFRIKYYFD